MLPFKLWDPYATKVENKRPVEENKAPQMPACPLPYKWLS